MDHHHHDDDESSSSSSILFSLFITCASMFLGAFCAGLSCCKLDRRQLAWLNCFACGLLLGTAVGVIIPEGVHALYEESNHNEHKEGILGWSLLLGFLTMMLLEDAFASANGGGGHAHAHDGIEGGGGLETDDNREALAKRRHTITLGLFIHNAMDGLAMGAAKASSSKGHHDSSMEHIVFGAIMMHHVPAAFGYATLLRNSGLEEFSVRRLMLLFSIAAPLSCAVTFFMLHPGLGFGAAQVSTQTVGVCLLYSAGSFLYVASVHALEDAKRGFTKWGLPQLGALALGAIVPGVTSWGHKH